MSDLKNHQRYGVSWLDISVKTTNALINHGAEDLSQVEELIRTNQLERVRGIGKTSVDEIMAAIDQVRRRSKA